MKKTFTKFALSSAFLLALPVVASAAPMGLIGDCVDCHTMHNSEQGTAVAKLGIGGTTTTQTPIENLLRMDCIACHVMDPDGTAKIADYGNGTEIPQVWHNDSSGDLAGGNWRYVSEGTSRNGHNVSDLFSGGDDNGSTYGAPPGKYRKSTHGPVFSTDPSTAPFDLFTCAGSAGCHGTRSNLLAGTTVDNGTANVWTVTQKRVGIAAVSGAHHNSYDGAKQGPQYTAAGGHDGQKVADGYRFIPGLKGYGNDASTDVRWQNVSETSHNEYFGNGAGFDESGCGTCHIQGNLQGSSRMTFNSLLRVPNGSMSGFCATCHGAFHSSGDGDGSKTNDGWGPNNGFSGAFLRHPSDYVIPTWGDYGAYTSYDLTAPVARPTVYSAASATVAPGTDLVMCLSCHMAHASENDYMLRFDYSLQSAGNASVQGLGEGCLVCHNSKGILPENR